jgi:excinuclease UvrABC ATPase subunit
VIDISSGQEGGRVVAAARPPLVAQSPKSRTGAYLT